MTKVAVVTGANQHLGFALVETLCKDLGADGIVCLTAQNLERRNEAVQDSSHRLNPGFRMEKRMEILSIHGSPRRNGSSSNIANHLVKKLEANGNEIHTFHLNNLDIHGCQECFTCRKNRTDTCAIKDGISMILELTKTSEVVIVSTPVFYADISAQLKCFIERTWSYFGKTGTSAEHLPRNRCLVFIQSYGYPDAHIYDQLFEKYKKYFNMFGFDECYLIKAHGAQYNHPEAANGLEVLKLAEEIAARIGQRNQAHS